jgi:hypothetical protein
LACERCIDVHKAQAVGAQVDECPCRCHKSKNKVMDTAGNVSYINMTNDGGHTGNVTLNSDGTFS